MNFRINATERLKATEIPASEGKFVIQSESEGRTFTILKGQKGGIHSGQEAHKADWMRFNTRQEAETFIKDKLKPKATKSFNPDYKVVPI